MGKEDKVIMLNAGCGVMILMPIAHTLSLSFFSVSRPGTSMLTGESKQNCWEGQWLMMGVRECFHLLTFFSLQATAAAAIDGREMERGSRQNEEGREVHCTLPKSPLQSSAKFCLTLSSFVSLP
jgi:hypothetical protein